jgi:hypothetical protein
MQAQPWLLLHAHAQSSNLSSLPQFYFPTARETEHAKTEFVLLVEQTFAPFPSGMPQQAFVDAINKVPMYPWPQTMRAAEVQRGEGFHRNNSQTHAAPVGVRDPSHGGALCLPAALWGGWGGDQGRAHVLLAQACAVRRPPGGPRLPLLETRGPAGETWGGAG